MMDVARHAGVAVSTVSHVVNGTRVVQSRTRTAVLAAIAATGYVPNTLARSLARSGARTHTLGVALSAVANPYFVEMVQSIVRACSERALTVFLADTGEDPSQELDVVRSLHQRQVDGILLAPAGVQAPWRSLDYLAAARVPTVLVDRLVSPSAGEAGGFSQVGVDNEAGIRLLVEHLRGLGHGRLGMVAGQPGVATTTERVAAFRRLAGASSDIAEPASADLPAARAAARRLLSSRTRPTAVIAGNNRSMIGLMQAVRDAGLAVPEQLAVAGFDDFEWADCFDPRLTLVAQPVEEIGCHALCLMEAVIADPTVTACTLQLPPRLMVRASCGARDGS
ncbi:LacI family DNA-binding transcriptional regulator [Lichenicoccus roseus]|uniref:LacI family transcriptional regulator n=1 Tax=Lichenicoccus roseus TaxID=2683649 RepID=A0A5R9JA24_9PROT|nr:LacI family DNA-binding transcriptional regulator [Lichenicoccus roseus]TLU73653.1 LacI family transcriptional regulator [Lichenicoccus roseus]